MNNKKETLQATTCTNDRKLKYNLKKTNCVKIRKKVKGSFSFEDKFFYVLPAE